MGLARVAAWLAGVWAGVLVGVGAIAAPAAFATLAVADAGRFVGRLFSEDAYLSLVLVAALFAIERLRARDVVAVPGSVMSTELLLILGALFCTVGGYFALLPMMEAARAGQGRWSFGQLHAVSASLFLLKCLLVAVLAWRLARARVSPSAIS